MMELRHSGIFRFGIFLILTICLWLASIIFRTRPYGVEEYLPLLITSIAFIVGVNKLYLSNPVATLICAACCVLIITAVDQIWGTYGYFDDYKNLKSYNLYVSMASILIAPNSFFYRLNAKPKMWALVLCWAVLVMVIFAIGNRMLTPSYGMIGTRYIMIVFISLTLAELARLYKSYTSHFNDSAT